MKMASNGRRTNDSITSEVKILEFLQDKKTLGIPRLIASGHYSVFENAFIIKLVGERLYRY
jgi:hypothetical protein